MSGRSRFEGLTPAGQAELNVTLDEIERRIKRAAARGRWLSLALGASVGLNIWLLAFIVTHP